MKPNGATPFPFQGRENLSIYETFPERMSLKKFGHALTKFDQISVMGGKGGESPYGGGYYGSTAASLLGQRMTRTKVRRDPAEKMFREGVVDK